MLAFIIAITSLAAGPPVAPVVEVEEGIYEYADARNGAGPLWCYGASCIARSGERLFASGLETLKGVEPLNDCRWLLFEREAAGWKLRAADPKDRTREPCPLGAFPDGRLFLSVNPSVDPAPSGPAHPRLLEFGAADAAAPPRPIEPEWEGRPAFTEHSYRGMAVDGPGRQILLLNILGHEAQHWCLFDRDGKPSARGRIVFPMGDYEKPEPIRLCYPQVALRGRAAHFLGISDIIEPVKAWREHKLKITGRTWDYDFRRLFYSTAEDITKSGFGPAVEIASREKTAGHISNLDLWLDPEGRAHLLWLETSADSRLRETFFPGVPITTSLEHAVVERGKVVRRTTLALGGEGASGEIPGWGHLHATPDGRLFALYFVGGSRAGKPVAENRILEILPGGGAGDPVRVPLAHPFTSFMTATERLGSPPSRTIDVLGSASGRPGISYARIRL
jgi:hypothetical protein